MSKTKSRVTPLPDGNTKRKELKTVTISTVMDPSPLQLMYLDKNILAERFEHSSQLMQQQKEEGDARRVKHDQRRRKFNRSVDTNQISFSRKFFENEVIGQILNLSQCERSEAEIRNHVLSYKEIMVVNRQNRQRRIDELKEADQQRLQLWEEVEAKREVNWLIRLDTNAQMNKRGTLLTAIEAANRDEAIGVVGDFIDKLIELVDWTITCREIGGFSLIPKKSSVEGKGEQTADSKEFDAIPPLIWEDVKRLTSSSLPFAKPLPHLQHALPSTLILPFCISDRPKLADPQWLLCPKFDGAHVLDHPLAETSEGKEGQQEPSSKLSSYLCIEDWNSYIQNLNSGSLATANLPAEEMPAYEVAPKEKDYVFTPPWLHTVPPPYLLGEAIIAVRRAIDPIPPEPEVRFDTSHIPLRIALFGLSDVMKKKMSEQLQAAIPRIKVITMEKLIQEAIEYFNATETDLDTEYGQLTKEINDSLYNGVGITDVHYANLLVHSIKSMSKRNNGFVIEDYPNSAEQLLLFLEALSGIRYDSHRPQPSDYASPFAPMHPQPEWGYDVKKCGIDFLICVDEFHGSGIDGPLRERVRARKNLYTQEIVYLDDEATSVKGLQQLYDPTRPVSTAGVDMTVCEQDVEHLINLCENLTLLQCINGQDFTSHEEAIVAKVMELRDKYIPLEQWNEDYWVQVEDEELVFKREETERVLLEAFEAAVEAVDGELSQTEELPADSENPPSSDVVPIQPSSSSAKATDASHAEDTLPAELPPVVFPPNPPIIFEEHKLPNAVARVLKDFWESQEKFGNTNGEIFYHAVQDLRFKTLQRRRVSIDTVYYCMMRYDNRQELFNNFRDKFNSLDEELRYDPDCIIELHLRLLELRNALSKICEERYQKVKELITTIQNDNHISILLYHVKCEASFFLQNQLNQFYSLLQIIFDYTKSTQGYLLSHRVENELEVLLPSAISEVAAVEASAKGGKDVKGKDTAKDKKAPAKDKNAAANTFTPYREAVAPFLLLPTHQQMIAAIPNKKAEENSDPKAKGKGKDKKNDEGIVMEPFQDVLLSIRDEIEPWKEGNFKVSRELYYNGEDSLCANIEKAVWFEANKLILASNTIEAYHKTHLEWMEDMEKNMIIMLNELAHNRFLRELAAGEALCRVIENCIAQAIPISALWLVTPDASSPVEPHTAWERFRHHLEPEDILEHEYTESSKKKVKESRPSTAPAPSSHHLEENEVHRPASSSSSRSVRQPMRSKRDDVKSLAYLQRLQNHNTSAKGSHGGGSGSGSGRHSGHSHRSARNTTHRTSSGHQHHQHHQHNHPSFSINRSGTPQGHHGSSKLTNIVLDDHQQQEFLQSKATLEQKLLHHREEKEQEYVRMGMSLASAKLAAHNECILDEEHQLADLIAHFKHKAKNSA